MVQSKLLLVFGDQTFDIPSALQELISHRQKSKFLHMFLNEISNTLQQEVATIPLHEKSWFPGHANIDTLADQYSRNARQCTAPQMFLTTVVQLGNLILSVERDPSLLSSESDVGVIAICTGALSGAAACLATSLQELLNIAGSIAAVSLRLGIAMQKRAEALEKSIESWAFTASNLDEEELDREIESYNKACSFHRVVFVSSRSRQTFTISGPPSSLQLFRQFSLFNTTKTLDLPITAPYHAPHLLGPRADDLLDPFTASEHERYVHRNLLSPYSGTPYETQSARNLLTEVIDEILYKPLSWTRLIDGLLDGLSESDVTLRSIGPASCASYILKELSMNGISATSAPMPTFKPGIDEKYFEPGDIAIVGMAGRFPGADDLEGFWNALESGLDLHRQIPSDRFDVKSHFDSTGGLRNSTLTPYGVFIDEPGLFDVRMFNMSPREAAQTDPMQRLLLLTTYEALEMAGYSPGRTPSSIGSRVGSFFGQTSDDWREVNASQNVDTFFITGGIRAFGPGRLNYHFKWDGPSYSIDTACSSSAASIQLACSALLAREVDTAVAGGANILTASDLFAGLSRGGFLSKTGGCKTFDDAADGYCRGDAIGVVVLKRLEDAIYDNDNVLAVIKAVATNHSSQAVSITHPHAETQQTLFQKVLRKSNLTANDIDAVELHGTGTQAGDFTEFSSVLGVFGGHRPLDRPVYIGTVKPNIGHGEAASGVTSLIKSIMMLRQNVIPPHVGIKGRINHRLPPLHSVPLKLATAGKVAWPRPVNSKRRILINNFDAAGGNTSMIIEDPPIDNTNETDPRGHHVVTVSGRTVASFEQNRERLLEFVKKHDADIANTAYTTTARRQHHVYKRAYSVRSTRELATVLEKDKASMPPERVSKPKASFIFTGQGSHYSAMGKQLFDTNSRCRQWFTEYNSMCIQQGFQPFLGLIKGELDTNEASPSQIQLAIVSVELVFLRLWESWGVEPDAVLGHSLGEYAALVAADVLSAWDALYLVGTRAKLMERNCTAGTHLMLALKLPAAEVVEILDHSGLDSCEIACINGPQSTVVSGAKEDIATLQERFTSKGVKTITLSLPFAFHSGQMDAILDEFKNATRSTHYSPPNIPVASPLTGNIIKEIGIIDADYLVNQCRKPVNFLGALLTLQSYFTSGNSMIWIETGPRPLCLQMAKSSLDVIPERLVPSLDKDQDVWATLTTGLTRLYNAGVDVNWNEFHKEYEHSLRLIQLPSYAFELKNYWIQYEGDWSITKGQGAKVSHPEDEKFGTTSLHHIDSETVEDGNITVVFSTNIVDPSLRPAIDGHQVNKVGLCPSSLYADMAMTAAAYLHSKLLPNVETPSIEVASMEVTKPFVADPTKTKQYLHVTAHKKSSSDLVQIKFTSLSVGMNIDHATCIVIYDNGKRWLAEWLRQKYLIDGRLEKLKHAEDATTHKILRGMVYKLFSTLVTYSERYQGLTKVYLDSEAFEAVGEVNLPSVVSKESFFFNPYWIDSLLHLSGFVLNGSDTTAEDAVYISHGWQSLRLPSKLEEGRSYQTYVRMQPLESNQIMAGDVYILDRKSIVGLCSGLKFQRIKKSILGHLLPKATPTTVQDGSLLNQITVRRHSTPKLRSAPRRDLFEKAISMIALEAEIARTELEDDVEFVEIGIDSLLSLTITAKLRELTDQEIPSSLFITHPTVSDLRAFLQNEPPDLTSSPGSASEDFDDSESSFDGGQTRIVDTSTENIVAIGISTTELSPSFLRKVISDELGVPEYEILPDTDFVDMGLDSLMSLVITGTVKSLTGQTLEPDFFLRNPTFGHLLQLYGNSKPPPTTEKSGSLNQLRIVRNPGVGVLPDVSPNHVVDAEPPGFALPRSGASKCTSILLQGTGSSKSKLFLFPDGSGSAARYGGLPFISGETAVYGLNSPHLGSSTPFSDSIESIVNCYVEEIRSRQPQGSYVLGGWSIGGVYAYEAARQLVSGGDNVSGIILIDSPCPKRLPPMSEETIDLLSRYGLFGYQQSISTSLQQHFFGSVRALHNYVPKHMPSLGLETICLAIWAREGVFQNSFDTTALGEIAPDAVDDWLLFPRTSYDSTGWDELLPNYKSIVLDGNHFTIMKQPLVENLGAHIRAELQSFL